MVMSPAGPGTKNDCAGEGQQQFTRTEARAPIAAASKEAA
jgi:hypothetical protein